MDRLPLCLAVPSTTSPDVRQRYVEVLVSSEFPFYLLGPRRFWLARDIFETVVNAGGRFTVLREADKRSK